MKEKSSHSHNYSVSNIKVAFLLNFFFTVLELIGGILFNSMAILSDALHDLGDSISLGLAWVFGKLSQKDHNEQFTYGYKRYSLLAALINTIVLIVGSFIVLWNAVPRLLDPVHANAKGMIGFAIIGIMVNGFAVLKTKKGKTLNEKVISWHLLEDVLGWIGVLIVGLIMFVKDIHILDPILAIVFTVYILYNVFINFRKTILLFLQAVPEDININKLDEMFKDIKNVQDVQHTHVWSLDSEHHVLTTHLIIKSSSDLKDINRIKREAHMITKKQDFEHVTIEIDFEQEHTDCFSKD